MATVAVKTKNVNVTVAEFAAALMNQIALKPEFGQMEMAVELVPGEDYARITGYGTALHCEIKNGKLVSSPFIAIQTEEIG